jgi:hypothetical protein
MTAPPPTQIDPYSYAIMVADHLELLGGAAALAAEACLDLEAVLAQPNREAPLQSPRGSNALPGRRRPEGLSVSSIDVAASASDKTPR